MNTASRKITRAIVPDEKGKAALEHIPGVKATVVEPGQPIPDSAVDAEILVVGPAEQPQEVDDALRQIEQLPQLKMLQTLGQGVEQWDGRLPAELKLATARGAHGGSTAEWAVAALLSLVRDLPHYMRSQRSHFWQGRRARTLQAMNILVYGAGDLGQNIQRRLLPFGAHITMVGSHGRDGIVDVATARGLLKTAGAVIISLPLTADTTHMVDADFLALLPDDAIVINAGRGVLLDQTALLAELSSGRLLAALDVTTPEPLPPNDPLWAAPGLLLTPHVGGNTDGADDRAWRVATEQIEAYLNHALSQ